MEVVIVEDEHISADKLCRQLRKIDDTIVVKAIISSIREARSWFATNSCDLIFLDIHLSDGLSFRIFESQECTIPVIFTTAYDEYAIKAFKLHSVDYLLKPIHIRDLEHAVAKYFRLVASMPARFDIGKIIEQLGGEGKKQYKSAFLITQGERIVKIGVDNIAYFFADAKHVFAVDAGGKQHVVDVALDALMEQVNPALFFRLNRKILVNSSAIGKMYTWPKSKIKIELVPPFADDVIVPSEKVRFFKEWLTNIDR